MHYGNGRPGIVATLAVLLVGMAACAAWAWSARPDAARAFADRLGDSEFVLLAVFVLAGLVAATLLASMAERLMQVVAVLMQAALLGVVVLAVVVLWRSHKADTSDGGSSLPSLAEVPFLGGGSTERTVPPPPAPVDPEERRRELETELLELDTRDGKPWWDHE